MLKSTLKSTQRLSESPYSCGSDLIGGNGGARSVLGCLSQSRPTVEEQAGASPLGAGESMLGEGTETEVGTAIGTGLK